MNNLIQKTEHICTILNWNHALLWVILTKWSNTRLPVSWIDNQESGNYKYPHGVETNGISRKWVAENLERYGDQWASSEVCQGVPEWDLVCQESNGMEPQQCKYCLSISLQFRIIGAWKCVGIAHAVIKETTNYTVMCGSKRKSEARWKYEKKIQEENPRQEKGEKHMVYVKKWLNWFFLM